jgi:hypothetical protein
LKLWNRHGSDGTPIESRALDRGQLDPIKAGSIDWWLVPVESVGADEPAAGDPSAQQDEDVICGLRFVASASAPDNRVRDTPLPSYITSTTCCEITCVVPEPADAMI